MSDIIDYAKSLEGTLEWKKGSNPKIVQMFKDAGHPEVVNDDTAWCAAFVGHVLKHCGYTNSGSLLARSYLNYGTPVSVADMQPGDVIIWSRGNSSWQGHVEFALAKQGMFVKVIGGNVQDQVKVYNRKIDNSLLGIRRPVKSSLKPAVSPEKEAVKPLIGTSKSAIAGIIAAIGAAIAYYLGVFK